MNGEARDSARDENLQAPFAVVIVIGLAFGALRLPLAIGICVSVVALLAYFLKCPLAVRANRERAVFTMAPLFWRPISVPRQQLIVTQKFGVLLFERRDGRRVAAFKRLYWGRNPIGRNPFESELEQLGFSVVED